MREGRGDASLAKRVLCILHPQRPAVQGGDGYILRGKRRIGQLDGEWLRGEGMGTFRLVSSGGRRGCL